MSKNLLRLAAFSAGLFFFCWVLSSFGIHEVFSLLSRAGITASAALFFYPFMCLWDVAAWRNLFPHVPERRVRFAGLFWIRLAGEALNNITPFLDVGGEPLKVHLVCKRFRVTQPSAMASVVVAKTAGYISQAAFMFAGFALSFNSLALGYERRLQLCIISIVICFVFIGFLMLQKRDAFRRMNPEIGLFYKEHPGRFWGSVAMSGMSWIVGGIETYFFCRLVGMDVSLKDGLMLEGLTQLVRTASFFIPMSLGAQEGGLALFVGAMGYSPVNGVAISVLKRARQFLWTLIGFFAWGVFHYSKRSATSPVAS